VAENRNAFFQDSARPAADTVREQLPAAGRTLHHEAVTHRLTHRRYRLPFLRVVRTAHGPWREREGLLVRLEDEAGRAGYGEVAPVPSFGTETLAEAGEVLAGLGDRVNAAALAGIGERFGCVRFALAAALEGDGGGPAVAERLPVAALLPAGRAAFAAADEARDKGYVAFKWKVGVLDASDELAMLDDLLARLPGGAQLRLDANGAWTTRQAAKWLERCAERPIEFVEQPVAARSVDALAGLAGDFPTTLALDESVAGLASLRAWLERGWPGVVVVKPALAGAPASVLALLAEHQADAVFSSAFETSVGRRAALRTAFRFQGRRPPRALGFGVVPLFKDGRFEGLPAAPFVSAEDVSRMNLEEAWNALN
jgi:O-succinylbenzoate synthase